jgi:hypothetical protein
MLPMPDSLPTKQADKCLEPFLQARTQREAQRNLESLLDSEVRPLIGKILYRKLQVWVGIRGTQGSPQSQEQADAEEVCQDALVKIVEALQKARSFPDTCPILSLPGLTVTVVSQQADLYIRKRYPKRASLSNKLRFLLDNRPHFARWQIRDGEWLAGYRRWQDQGLAAISLEPLHAAARFQREVPQVGEILDQPDMLLAKLFDWAGGPVPMAELVALMAEVWDVRDHPAVLLPTDDDSASGMPPAARAALTQEGAFTEEVANQECLRRYWAAICDLPPKQRCSLLFQASDPVGNSLIHLLHACGIASLPEIAVAAKMSLEALKRIYHELPWEDKKVAEALETTVQYVIRLRAIARGRIREQIKGTA